MAIKVKNIATGEVFVVNNACWQDGKILAHYKSPMPKANSKFFASHPYFVYTEKVENYTSKDVLCRVIDLADGYEICKERKPREKKSDVSTEAAEVVTETTDAVIIDETTEEPTEEPTAKHEPAVVETPSLDEASKAFAALTPLFSGVQANVAAAVMKEIQPLISKVEAVCGRAPQIITHVVKSADVTTTFGAGEVFHTNFDDVCNRIARGSWVYLYGPTGSGKNVMAEQIARALGLEFHYQAHTLDRFELTGFIDANGHYQPTEFYKAYTEGGLFMLDELDGSDENALITLNSASNGYFAFPCGTVKAHENFRCIAAGNTCGRGGTDDYTARRVMDISSLGRFIPRYHGYCDVIDLTAANGNEELVEFIHALRKVKKETGCQIIASPRQIKEIVKDEAQGLNLTNTLSDMFGTYLTEDEINIVRERLQEICKTNKYTKAFENVQAIIY